MELEGSKNGNPPAPPKYSCNWDSSGIQCLPPGLPNVIAYADGKKETFTVKGHYGYPQNLVYIDSINGNRGGATPLQSQAQSFKEGKLFGYLAAGNEADTLGNIASFQQTPFSFNKEDYPQIPQKMVYFEGQVTIAGEWDPAANYNWVGPKIISIEKLTKVTPPKPGFIEQIKSISKKSAENGNMASLPDFEPTADRADIKNLRTSGRHNSFILRAHYYKNRIFPTQKTKGAFKYPQQVKHDDMLSQSKHAVGYLLNDDEDHYLSVLLSAILANQRPFGPDKDDKAVYFEAIAHLETKAYLNPDADPLSFIDDPQTNTYITIYTDEILTVEPVKKFFIDFIKKNPLSL